MTVKQSDAAEVPVPLAVRLLLGRAAVQVIASDAGADLLHIKGNAVDTSLRAREAPGTDIDVMARPTHVPRLHDELLRHGWVVYSSFRYGSPFGHAQTYRHPDWGYLDLHRMFPGIPTTAPAPVAVNVRRGDYYAFDGFRAMYGMDIEGFVREALDRV